MSLVAPFTPLGKTVCLVANSAAPTGIQAPTSTGLGVSQYHVLNSGSNTAYLTYANDANTAQSIASGYIASNVLTPSFFAPLLSSLSLSIGAGSATYTRATQATCFGYKETDGRNASQSMLIIPSGIPRFSGARFIASNNTWSTNFADGYPIPDSQLLGYLSETAATNFAFPSGPGVVAATCTTAALSAASFTLSFKGTGSVTGTGGFVGTLNGTGTNNRVSLTVTATAAAATLTVTGSVTEMQLEAGTFPTSLIPTTAAAATRNADSLTYSTTGNVNPAAGTIYGEFTVTNSTAIYNSFLTIDDGTINNNIELYSNITTANISTVLRSGGVVQVNATNGTISAGVRNKLAFDWTTNHANSSNNGVLGTVTNTVTPPVSLTTIEIAARSYSPLTTNSNIRNIKIWQSQLDDSVISYLTGATISSSNVIPILPNTSAVYSAPSGSFFSAITSISGANNLYITPGEGQ